MRCHVRIVKQGDMIERPSSSDMLGKYRGVALIDSSIWAQGGPD